MNRNLRYVGLATPSDGKKVKKVTVKLKVNDCTGTIKASDFMLQAGRILSGYICNTQEMLLRHRTDGTNIDPPQHFNGVLRGQNIIIVPNQGTATTGLDLKVTATRATTGAINIATYYNTKQFNYSNNLQAGDTLEIDSANHNVLVNGAEMPHDNYSGAPMTCPAGDAIYRINFNNRDVGTCLFTVTKWDKSGVNW